MIEKYSGQLPSELLEIMIKDFDLFLMLLNDKSFVNKYFEVDLYNQAVEKYGSLSFDECFVFAPLLALGGKESVDNLKKVKTKEHIALIVEMTGGI